MKMGTIVNAKYGDEQLDILKMKNHSTICGRMWIAIGIDHKAYKSLIIRKSAHV